MCPRDDVLNILRELAKRLEKRITVNSLILFGSYARGEERMESDIDFIVVSEDFPRKFSDRFDIVREAINSIKETEYYRRLREAGRYPQFSPIPYRPEELEDTPPLLLDVLEDGVILRDDGTMRRKLEELNMRLTDLGAKRKKSRSGRRYWVLKPEIKPGEVIEI